MKLNELTLIQPSHDVIEEGVMSYITRAFKSRLYHVTDIDALYSMVRQNKIAGSLSTVEPTKFRKTLYYFSTTTKRRNYFTLNLLTRMSRPVVILNMSKKIRDFESITVHYFEEVLGTRLDRGTKKALSEDELRVHFTSPYIKFDEYVDSIDVYVTGATDTRTLKSIEAKTSVPIYIYTNISDFMTQKNTKKLKSNTKIDPSMEMTLDHQKNKMKEMKEISEPIIGEVLKGEYKLKRSDLKGYPIEGNMIDTAIGLIASYILNAQRDGVALGGNAKKLNRVLMNTGNMMGPFLRDRLSK